MEAKFFRIIGNLKSSFNDLCNKFTVLSSRITTMENLVGGFVHSDNGDDSSSVAPVKKKL